MIWLLIIPLGLGAALVLFITPRLYLVGEVGTETARFTIRWLWASLTYNASSKQYSGRILFFKIKPREISPEHPAKPSPDEPSIPLEIKDSILKFKPSFISKNEQIDDKRVEAKSVEPWFWWEHRDLLKVLLKRVWRWLRNLMRALRVDEFRMRIICATSDAALTGILFGVLQPLVYNLPRRFDITVDADFERSKPQIEGTGSLSFRPAVVLGITLWLALRLPWIRLYYLKREWNKKTRGD